MRLWHIDLLPYLPDAQFRGQLRELVLIMHQWRDKGTTNHLLINKVMEYSKSELASYMWNYCGEYGKRYGDFKENILNEFIDFTDGGKYKFDIFKKWHNKEYLRVCMANLYEKHFFGVGKSRITDEEWQRLLYGYKTITGEDYVI